MKQIMCNAPLKSTVVLFIYVSTFLLIIINSPSCNSLREVTTVNMSGQILQGILMTSLDGRNFLGFMGIPYARPPVGKLRFKPPQPMKRSLKPLDLRKERDMCPQFLFKTETVGGNEDCLYLNVYTHVKVIQVPVLVVLYSMRFSSGHGGITELGPEYLMDRNLVVVTINFRLGALGFLSTGDSVLPGNYGLKDQLLALKWVKSNIKYFGGDSDRITLYGFGSGGASAQYHLLSPVSKGLFHRLFYHSGSALNFWAFQPNPMEIMQKVASIVSCSGNSTTAMIECIAKISAYDLVRTLYHFPHWVGLSPYPFGPVIETQKSKHDPPFLTMPPDEILASGVYNHVPTIAGVTRDESVPLAWTVWTNQDNLDELDRDFANVMRVTLNVGHLPQELAIKMRDFYFGDRVRNTDLRTLIRLFSDSVIAQAVACAAKQQALTSYAPVYFYRFVLKGRVSVFTVKDHETLGTSHGDDLLYIFKRKQPFPGGTPNAEERTSILRWGKLISNFAATGNPIPEKTAFFPELWTPLSKKKYFMYMEISNSLTLKEDDRFNTRMMFWESLMKEIRNAAHTLPRDEL